MITLELTVNPTQLPKGVRLVKTSLFNMLWRCYHSWSFPIRMTREKHSYPWPYDSHQTCTDCGAERYYDTGTMSSGPLFHREVK